MSAKEKKTDEKKEITSWGQDDFFKNFDEMLNDLRRSFFSYPRELYESYGLRNPRLWERGPLTDLVDMGDHYEVHMDIPGISKDKLQIDVTPTNVEIKGESVQDEQSGDKNYMMRERRSSSIYRKIGFPEEVLPHEAKAEAEDGVLVLSVPKKEPTKESKKHRVEVK
jgi:HSP20 family protein